MEWKWLCKVTTPVKVKYSQIIMMMLAVYGLVKYYH